MTRAGIEQGLCCRLPASARNATETSPLRSSGLALLTEQLDGVRQRARAKAKVTDRRTAADFAHCMRDLAEIHYAHAKRIRLEWTILQPAPPVPSMGPSLRRRHTVCLSAWYYRSHNFRQRDCA
jgi:hypothetical protein